MKNLPDSQGRAASNSAPVSVHPFAEFYLSAMSQSVALWKSMRTLDYFLWETNLSFQTLQNFFEEMNT